jgi:hypothetical protein
VTAHEDWLASRLDHTRAKAKETARAAQVREMAVATVNCFVMSLPEEDRESAMSAAARHLRTLYGAGEGEAEAVALFGSLAFSKVLQLGRVVAKAEAERLAHRLFPNPANDEVAS